MEFSPNRLPGFFPVGDEGGEAAIGEGVFDEGFEDARGDGGDVGADEGSFFDVIHGADGGGEDVGREVLVVVVDGADFADDVHAV